MQYLRCAYGEKRLVPPLHDLRQYERVLMTGAWDSRFFRKEDVMHCDLCKHESSVDGSLLCATCSEAIRRLMEIQRNGSGDEKASSDHSQGIRVRTTEAGRA